MVSIGHSGGGQRGAAVLSSRAAIVLSSVVLFTTLPVAVNALNATGVAARSTTTGVGGGHITQWHARGIGGGGAFFNVAFHPTDPRLFMLTTDMGQCETSH